MNKPSSLPNANTADEANVLPSEEDIRLYEERGWHITPPILEPEFLDGIIEAIEAHQRGERDRPLPRKGAKYSDWNSGETDGVRNNEFCSLQNDKVRELVLRPIIGEIAARLARSPAVRVFDDQAIHKPASSGEHAESAVGWHTDGSYWSTCTSDRMLTAWIPMADTSVDNGTLCVIEGSHLWPESDHVRGFNDKELGTIASRIGRDIPAEAIRAIELKKGQVSFHHMRTLHASSPNVSGRPRFAVALHMQDDGNRHQEFVTPDGTRIALPHDQLCRADENGHPDYTDPAVFPQIWP